MSDNGPRQGTRKRFETPQNTGNDGSIRNEMERKLKGRLLFTISEEALAIKAQNVTTEFC